MHWQRLESSFWIYVTAYLSIRFACRGCFVLIEPKAIALLGCVRLLICVLCLFIQNQRQLRRPLRWLMRLTFFVKKVSKNTIAESAVRPEGPDTLRCSRQTGCAELAALRHAAHLLPPDTVLLGGYQAHPRQKQKLVQRPSSVNNQNDSLVPANCR